MCKIGKILIFSPSFLAFFEEIVYNVLVNLTQSRYIIHFLLSKSKVFLLVLRKKLKRAEYDFKRNLLMEKI